LDVNSEGEMILTAANLSRAAPTEWDAFVKALERRTREAGDRLIGSEKDFLEVNQGRAQGYAFIYRTCKDCRELQAEMGSYGRK